jgi:hypothetical protein
MSPFDYPRKILVQLDDDFVLLRCALSFTGERRDVQVVVAG